MCIDFLLWHPGLSQDVKAGGTARAERRLAGPAPGWRRSSTSDRHDAGPQEAVDGHRRRVPGFRFVVGKVPGRQRRVISAGVVIIGGN